MEKQVTDTRGDRPAGHGALFQALGIFGVSSKPIYHENPYGFLQYLLGGPCQAFQAYHAQLSRHLVPAHVSCFVASHNRRLLGY